MVPDLTGVTVRAATSYHTSNDPSDTLVRAASIGFPADVIIGCGHYESPGQLIRDSKVDYLQLDQQFPTLNICSLCFLEGGRANCAVHVVRDIEKSTALNNGLGHQVFINYLPRLQRPP